MSQIYYLSLGTAQETYEKSYCIHVSKSQNGPAFWSTLYYLPGDHFYRYNVEFAKLMTLENYNGCVWVHYTNSNANLFQLPINSSDVRFSKELLDLFTKSMWLKFFGSSPKLASIFDLQTQIDVPDLLQGL